MKDAGETQERTRVTSLDTTANGNGEIMGKNGGVKVRNREMESRPGSLAVCSKWRFGCGGGGTADYPHTELQAGHQH